MRLVSTPFLGTISTHLIPLLLFPPFLPFLWSDIVFQEEKNLYRKLVAKSNEKTVLLSYESVDNLEVYIYVFFLIYLTKTPFSIDMTGIPNQYQSYIESVIHSKVIMKLAFWYSLIYWFYYIISVDGLI